MKKYLSYIFASIVLAFIISCHHDSVEIKKPSQQTSCDSFEVGAVLVGISPTLPIEQIFAYVNQYPDVVIKQMIVFNFYSDLPKDSLNYVSSYLNQLTYLQVNGFLPHVTFDSTSNKLLLDVSFANMNSTNQRSWLEAMNMLKIEKSNSNFYSSYLYLGVPVGQEKQYVNIFYSNNWTLWAELNCYFKITLD